MTNSTAASSRENGIPTQAECAELARKITEISRRRCGIWAQLKQRIKWNYLRI
jgi:hypothetical protein